MSARCGHGSEYRLDRSIFRIGADVKTTMKTRFAASMRIAECRANRCAYCGAWLSLGPANDGPADELEAATIMADVFANVEHVTDWQIAIGMAAYDADNDPPTGGLAWMWHAGWLARHIWITHDATHEHEGGEL